MQDTYKLERAQKELGENARKYFGKLELTLEIPDAGANDEETVARLLEWCGDAATLRASAVNGQRLARQKAVKLAVNEVADRVAKDTITQDAGAAELAGIINSPAEVTLRGEGSKQRRPSGRTKEAARREAQAEIQQNALRSLEGLTGARLAGAIALLEGMGIEIPAEYRK